MILIKRFIVSVLLLLFLTAPALAVEDMPELSQEPITVEAEADDKNIVVNVTLQSVPTPFPAPVPEETITNVDPIPTFTPYAVSSLDDAAAPTSTLSDTVRALFGAYTPRTQTITEYLADGTAITYQQVIPGVAGLDWPWLTGAGLFALCLYGVLRMIGGLLKS